MKAKPDSGRRERAVSGPRPSASKLLRGGVWLLLASVIGLGATLASRTPVSADPYALSAVTVGGVEASLPLEATAPALQAPSVVVTRAGENVLARDDSEDNSNPTGCRFYDNGKKMCGNAETLPAYRWGGSTDLDADTKSGLFGIGGAIRGLLAAVASMLFYIASLIWVCLLWLLRFGFGAEFVNLAAVAINKALVSIGNYAYALIIFCVAWVVYKARKELSRGQTKEFLTSLARLVVGFGLIGGLVTFANRVDQAAGSDAERIAATKGSVPWVAKTVSDSVVGLSATLTQISRISDWGSAVALKGGGNDIEGEGPAPTCKAYLAGLHDIYSQGDGTAALSAVSQFWEQTYYKSLTYAGFGLPTRYKSQILKRTYSVDLASRSMCRWSEIQSGISGQTQLKIQIHAWTNYESAYGPSPFTTSSPTNVFDGSGRDDQPEFDVRRAVVAWNACAYRNGAWYTHDPWRMAWIMSNSGNADVTQIDGKDHFENQKKQCTEAFMNGKLSVAEDADSFDIYTQGHSVRYQVPEILSDIPAAEQQKTIATDHLRAAKVWRAGFRADNSGQRLMFGFLAILVALLSFYIFGFMAVGLLGAQLMLITLLCLLPVTIAMVALGNATGTKLIKLTGTTMISKGLFTLIITVMIAVTQVVQTIAMNIITGSFSGAGLAGAVLVSLAPIAAAFAVRSLLQKAGLGDIMKPTGALSFVSAAAAKAAGDPNFGNWAQAGLNTGLGKKFGAKADKFGVMDGIKAGWDLRPTDKAKAQREQDRVDKEIAAIEAQKAAAEAEQAAQGKADELLGWAKANGVDMSEEDEKRLRDRILEAETGHKPTAVEGENAQNGEDETVPVVPADETATDDEETAAAEAQRQYVQSLNGEPEEAAGARVDRVDNLVSGVNGRRFGPNFGGFHTESEKAAYAYAYAQANNMSAADVVIGENGLVMARPMPLDQARQTLDAADLERQWQHFLPDTVQARRDNESDTEYVTRLHVEGLERGLVTSDGKPISVLKKVGIDVNNAEHQAALENWKQGIESELTAKLANVRFDAPDSAATARLVMVAQARSRESVARVNVRRAAADREITATLEEFAASIPVRLEATRTSADGFREQAEAYHQSLDILRDLTRRQASPGEVAAADAALSAATAALETAQRAYVSDVWAARQDVIHVSTVTSSDGGGARAAQMEAATRAAQAEVEQIRALADAVRLGQEQALDTLRGHCGQVLRELSAEQTRIHAYSTSRTAERARQRAGQDSRYGDLPPARVRARDVLPELEPFPR